MYTFANHTSSPQLLLSSTLFLPTSSFPSLLVGRDEPPGKMQQIACCWLVSVAYYSRNTNQNITCLNVYRIRNTRTHANMHDHDDNNNNHHHRPFHRPTNRFCPPCRPFPAPPSVGSKSSKTCQPSAPCWGEPHKQGSNHSVQSIFANRFKMLIIPNSWKRCPQSGKQSIGRNLDASTTWNVACLERFL